MVDGKASNAVYKIFMLTIGQILMSLLYYKGSEYYNQK